MFCEQLFLVNAFWQFAIVPKHNAVVIYFHLCMYSHIVTVYDGLCKQLHYVTFCNFFAKCGLTIKNIR